MKTSTGKKNTKSCVNERKKHTAICYMALQCDASIKNIKVILNYLTLKVGFIYFKMSNLALSRRRVALIYSLSSLNHSISLTQQFNDCSVHVI